MAYHTEMKGELLICQNLFCRPAHVGAEEPADRRSQVKSDINLKENAQDLI